MTSSRLRIDIDTYRETPKKSSSWIQQLLRIFQFLSSTISLGIFSRRFSTVMKLYRQATTAQGAVQGILAAAVAYGICTMLIKFCVKGGPSWLRWLLVLLDILFVGAFIATAVLTRPTGNGSAGPHGPGCQTGRYQRFIPKSFHCNLPYGTFALAIFSTLLHAATALWQDYRKKGKVETRPEVREDRAALKNVHSGNMSSAQPTYTDSSYATQAKETQPAYEKKDSRTDSGVYPDNYATDLSEKQIDSNGVDYHAQSDIARNTAAVGVAGVASVATGAYAANKHVKTPTSVDQAGHSVAAKRAISNKTGTDRAGYEKGNQRGLTDVDDQNGDYTTGTRSVLDGTGTTSSTYPSKPNRHMTDTPSSIYSDRPLQTMPGNTLAASAADYHDGISQGIASKTLDRDVAKYQSKTVTGMPAKTLNSSATNCHDGTSQGFSSKKLDRDVANYQSDTVTGIPDKTLNSGAVDYNDGKPQISRDPTANDYEAETGKFSPSKKDRFGPSDRQLDKNAGYGSNIRPLNINKEPYGTSDKQQINRDTAGYDKSIRPTTTSQIDDVGLRGYTTSTNSNTAQLQDTTAFPTVPGSYTEFPKSGNPYDPGNVQPVDEEDMNTDMPRRPSLLERLLGSASPAPASAMTGGVESGTAYTNAGDDSYIVGTGVGNVSGGAGRMVYNDVTRIGS